MILSSQPGRMFRCHGSRLSAGWGFTRSLPQPLMEKNKKNKDVAVTKTAEQPVATDATNAAQDARRKPVATIRVEDVSCSIWAREHVVQGQPKVFYSVTIERSYKDRDGRWRYTKSLDPESLGKVVAACQQASESIAGLMQRDAAA